MKKYGYDEKSDSVYLQTFNFKELKRIKTELLPKLKMDLKLVQLISSYTPIGTKQKKKIHKETGSITTMTGYLKTVQ
ncbi:hypothetical protein A4A71_05560 [Nicoletella semolina]|nr:hypothetical protein [Nicoletella semolina]